MTAFKLLMKVLKAKITSVVLYGLIFLIISTITYFNSNSNEQFVLSNGSITGRIYFGNSSLGDLHGCRFNLQRWNAYRQRKSCVHQLVCAVHHVSLPFDTRFRVAEKYPRCGFSQPDIRSRNVFSLRSIRSYAIPVALGSFSREISPRILLCQSQQSHFRRSFQHA